MSHSTMLSKYGNCTRLLKIKKTEGENRLFLQKKTTKKKNSGRILDLWAFLIKQLLYSRLLDMRWL